MMNGKEFLRLDDFVKALGKKQKASKKESVKVFGEFDANKDGYISRFFFLFLNI